MAFWLLCQSYAIAKFSVGVFGQNLALFIAGTTAPSFLACCYFKASLFLEPLLFYCLTRCYFIPAPLLIQSYFIATIMAKIIKKLCWCDCLFFPATTAASGKHFRSSSVSKYKSSRKRNISGMKSDLAPPWWTSPPSLQRSGSPRSGPCWAGWRKSRARLSSPRSGCATSGRGQGACPGERRPGPSGGSHICNRAGERRLIHDWGDLFPLMAARSKYGFSFRHVQGCSFSISSFLVRMQNVTKSAKTGWKRRG